MRKPFLKISWAFYLASGATLGIFLLLNVQSLLDSKIKIQAEYEKSLKSRTDSFIESITSSLVMGDYVQVVDSCKRFSDKPDVADIMITLADGQTLFTKTNSLQREQSSGNKIAVKRDIILDVPWNESERSVLAKAIVTYDISRLKETIFQIGQRYLLGLLSFLGFVSMVGAILTRYVSKPLARLSRITSGGALQDISAIKPSSVMDEIALLEKSISSMGKNLIKLNEAEKDAAVGRTISQISHDLRAPLSNFEQILMITGETPVSTIQGKVKEALFRIFSMIDSLKRSDLDQMVKPIVNCIDFESALTPLRAKANGMRINLEYSADLDRGFSFWLDAPKFERAWTNLIINAIESANSLVRLQVSMNGAELVLQVIDDGLGVPDEFIPKLFQRGATFGKAEGTGLGLAYARQIMRGHGGDVTYRRENGLTIFECRLPNAVASARENSMKKQIVDASVENVDRKKLVAVCFKPESLNRAILAILDSQKTENFHFSCEYEGAEVVATNDSDIALDAIEDGKEPLEFSASLQEAAIVDRLKRRFHLV